MNWTCATPIITFVLAAGCCAPAASPPKLTRSAAAIMPIDPLLARARETHGAAYLEAERALLASPDAASALTRVAADPTADAVEKLWANCLGEMAAGRAPEYAEAFVIIDGLARSIPARTPLPSPSPETIAHQLSVRLGDRAAPYLSVRLVKGTDWPRWKMAGVLMYLAKHPRPETAAPLVRFASQAADAAMRNFALNAARAADAHALPALLAQERKRATRLGRPWPAEMQAAADIPVP